jgi:predicted metal-dependent phosphotriesterase family hydrolase
VAVLEAAAQAQRATGAPLLLTVPPDRDAEYVQRLLSELLGRLGLGATASLH